MKRNVPSVWYFDYVFFPRGGGCGEGAVAAIAPVATGNGPISFVDDDPGVLTFLNDALSDLGYEPSPNVRFTGMAPPGKPPQLRHRRTA
jgi:hypothetical protein